MCKTTDICKLIGPRLRLTLVALVACCPLSLSAQDPLDGLKDHEKEFIRHEASNVEKLKVEVGAIRSKRDLLKQKLKEIEISIALLEKKVDRMEKESESSEEFDSETPKVKLPSEFVATVSPRIVVIEGDAGNGTGFLCTTEGEVWVYTAAHVLSGNRKITVRDSQGRRYREFEFLECAEGVDLVRLKPKKRDFEGLPLVSQKEAPEVGDEIVAIGNSGGTGSLSGEAGSIVNIEDEMWEVNADIIPGNSGGPVLSLESRKVVGIVTHLIIRHDDAQDHLNDTPEVQRFAARLDKEWKWRRMPVTRFVKEWQYIEKMQTETSIAWAAITLIKDKLNEHGVHEDDWALAESVVAQERGHRTVSQLDSWLKRFGEAKMQKGRVSYDGNKMITGIRKDIGMKGNEPGSEDFSWYHRQKYLSQVKWKKALSQTSR